MKHKQRSLGEVLRRAPPSSVSLASAQCNVLRRSLHGTNPNAPALRDGLRCSSAQNRVFASPHGIRVVGLTGHDHPGLYGAFKPAGIPMRAAVGVVTNINGWSMERYFRDSPDICRHCGPHSSLRVLNDIDDGVSGIVCCAIDGCDARVTERRFELVVRGHLPTKPRDVPGGNCRIVSVGYYASLPVSLAMLTLNGSHPMSEAVAAAFGTNVIGQQPTSAAPRRLLNLFQLVVASGGAEVVMQDTLLFRRIVNSSPTLATDSAAAPRLGDGAGRQAPPA